MSVAVVSIESIINDLNSKPPLFINISLYITITDAIGFNRKNKCNLGGIRSRE